MSSIEEKRKTPLNALATTGASVGDVPTFDGTNWVNQAPASTVIETLHIREEQPSGTNAGTSVAGTQTRVLNTIKKNTITGASLSSNQITLPAGEYDIISRAPSSTASFHKISFYNITDAVPIIIGSNAFASSGTSSQTDSKLIGSITVPSIKVFELRHYIDTAVSSTGLGRAVTSGDVEVYTEIFIKKVG